MSKTFGQADTSHQGTSNAVGSVSGNRLEKSGVMFDLTLDQQEYAKELLAEGIPKSKVIQMVIEDHGEIPRSRVIAI